MPITISTTSYLKISTAGLKFSLYFLLLLVSQIVCIRKTKKDHVTPSPILVTSRKTQQYHTKRRYGQRLNTTEGGIRIGPCSVKCNWSGRSQELAGSGLTSPDLAVTRFDLVQVKEISQMPADSMSGSACPGQGLILADLSLAKPVHPDLYQPFQGAKLSDLTDYQSRIYSYRQIWDQSILWTLVTFPWAAHLNPFQPVKHSSCNQFQVLSFPVNCRRIWFYWNHFGWYVGRFTLYLISLTKPLGHLQYGGNQSLRKQK